jgi:hypothetical protein
MHWKAIRVDTGLTIAGPNKRWKSDIRDVGKSKSKSKSDAHSRVRLREHVAELNN